MPPAAIQDLTLIHQTLIGQYTVIGLLKNNSPYGIVDVSLRVSLKNEAGEVVAEQFIPLLMKHVSPGEVAPFQAAFPDDLQGSATEAQIIALSLGVFERAPLTISVPDPPLLDGRQYTILGWLSNPGNSPVEIHRLVLISADPDWIPQELIVVSDRISMILPAESAPFLATFDHSPDLSHLAAYLDATIAPKPSPVPLVLVQGLRVAFDRQGNILVIGAIQNQSSLPYWLSGLVLLTLDEEVLSLATLHPPSPIGPGETRALGLTEFPGWTARLAALGRNRDDLSAELLMDPISSLASSIQIQQMDLEVTGLENTGSAILIRGSIYNPSQFTISQPSIQAEVRSIDGSVQSANWLLLQERLEAHQSSSFLLPIRLPSGIDLSMMEMDVRAMGIVDSPGFPAGLEP
jgi:hypothetical protein